MPGIQTLTDISPAHQYGCSLAAGISVIRRFSAAYEGGVRVPFLSCLRYSRQERLLTNRSNAAFPSSVLL